MMARARLGALRFAHDTYDYREPGYGYDEPSWSAPAYEPYEN